MAKFPFSFRGYVYQKALDDMLSAFNATMRALHTEHENNIALLYDIKRRTEVGEDTAEYDDEGEFLFDHESAQEIRIEQSQLAIRSGRAAFLLMLHHLWEKAVDDWRGAKPSDNYKSPNAYEWLEGKGFKINKDALEFLRMAANAIKHNNSQLFGELPDLFDLSIPLTGRIDFAATLRLEDHDIEELVAALKESGLHIDSTIGL